MGARWGARSNGEIFYSEGTPIPIAIVGVNASRLHPPPPSAAASAPSRSGRLGSARRGLAGGARPVRWGVRADGRAVDGLRVGMYSGEAGIEFRMPFWFVTPGSGRTSAGQPRTHRCRPSSAPRPQIEQYSLRVRHPRRDPPRNSTGERTWHQQQPHMSRRTSIHRTRSASSRTGVDR